MGAKTKSGRIPGKHRIPQIPGIRLIKARLPSKKAG